MITDPCLRAVEDFSAWAAVQVSRASAEGCPECLRYLLVGRRDFLGQEDPTRWKAADVRGLLRMTVSRLTGSCLLADHAVPALRAYLEFLGETERLHPGSASPKTLVGSLDAGTVRAFADGMGDRSRFRMAKTFYAAMIGEGVDVTDDDAVDEWMQVFSLADEERRKTVLAHLWDEQPDLRAADFIAREGKVAAIAPDQARPDSIVLLPPEERPLQQELHFAPVPMPSQELAAEAARQSLLLNQVLTLAGWIGRGRKVTKEGLPVPADVRALAALFGLGAEGVTISKLQHVPDLMELFWLARQTELIEVRRDALVAGRRLTGREIGDLDDGSVLELWHDVFTLVEQGRSVPAAVLRRDHTAMAELALIAGSTLPAIMVGLYQEAGSGSGLVDLRPFVSGIDGLPMMETHGSVEDANLETILATNIYGRIFRLADHGAVVVEAPTREELESRNPGMPLLALTQMPIAAELTPIGRLHINLALLAEGADAPTSSVRSLQPR